MALSKPTYPGLALGPSSQSNPGPGTHTHNSQIYASLAGRLVSTPSPLNATTKIPELSVIRPSLDSSTAPPSRFVARSNALPAVNDVVLARVTRLQPRQVAVSILVVGEEVCADTFQGVVRKEDVRALEVDKVVIGECFRVGDVVRAVVISLGDQSSYYLSTARNELGVLMATSEEGNAMVPVSWKEFRDPVTGRGESRKVAKPF